jgi:GntP family gluconate:H+ symporter
MDPLWILFLGMAVVVGAILGLRLHAFLALLAGALVVATLTSGSALEKHARNKDAPDAEVARLVSQSPAERVARELGRTVGSIGILIAMAAIIGKCLLESGAAERIVRSALKLVGPKHAPLAFMGSGFTLGVPVYFDTVFYLMIPLGKAMALRDRARYGLIVMGIIAATTMAHSLVPPTPGPLLVASRLDVNLGHMMLGGIVLGVLTCFFGYFYALWSNRRWPVPLRDSVEMPLADLEDQSRRRDVELPPLGFSLLPIALPVLLIAGNSILETTVGAPSQGWFRPVSLLFSALGDKNVALILGAAIALILLAWQKRSSRSDLAAAVQTALAGAGVIILITSAGGAFGGVLQQTGIATRIQDLAAAYQIAALPLAFFVTALVRTAQGSATVAMITAVGILGGMGDPAQLGFHPLYLALAIGCGSKPFPWMNDSGFWIISRMSGMTETETLRNFSVMISLMGLAGLVILMIAARLLPLV